MATTKKTQPRAARSTKKSAKSAKTAKKSTPKRRAINIGDEHDVTFFATPAEWRRWLEENHATQTDKWVGFHKRQTGKESITWPESVDEALCFGWIDGVRKSIDESAYKIRFTPRKPTSVWSKVNVARVAVLTKEGRMTEAGHAAFARRTDAKTGIYSSEREKDAELPADMQARFEKNKKAWRYFQSRPPWYRRTSLHWVVSAKREETRAKRFEQLLRDSASEQHIPMLRRP